VGCAGKKEHVGHNVIVIRTNLATFPIPKRQGIGSSSEDLLVAARQHERLEDIGKASAFFCCHRPEREVRSRPSSSGKGSRSGVYLPGFRLLNPQIFTLCQNTSRTVMASANDVTARKVATIYPC
jgi:hypothetical protein